MGKRPRDKRRRDTSLRGRVESALMHQHQHSTDEDLVRHLLLTHREYSRFKQGPFTQKVKQILQLLRRSNEISIVSDDGGDTPTGKKRRKNDEKEEKLQLIEAQHLRNRRSDSRASSGGCSSSLASASSSKEDDLSDENVSTSGESVYGQKYAPKFDLMKSMICENYRRKSMKLRDTEELNEVEELEIVGNKDLKKAESTNVEGGKLGDGLIEIAKNNDRRRNDREINGYMFKDLGGLSSVIEQLKMEVIVPMLHPQIPCHLGVKPITGILLHGPPGCGKTTLAQAIANEAGVPFYQVSATELVSGVSGASEENIRELFSKAYRTAPSIVFIDEIDAISSKRDNLQREMERRIVVQLMTCMDELHRPLKPVGDTANSEKTSRGPGYVLVIGATNRPEAVDAGLRRPGRFDFEIPLGVPSESARIEILSVLTSRLKVEGAIDLVKLAKCTPGFVGSDLGAVANNAGRIAWERIMDQRKVEICEDQTNRDSSEDWLRQPLSHEEIEKLHITMTDLEESAKMAQPSTKREIFSAIPNVKWDDVGGLHSLRLEFDRYIVRRIKCPELYDVLGADLDPGFLLYGPPGCGKTLIAQAVANDAGANFIHVKGPELLDKYVGESELALRTKFSRARTCSPCIMFFDEVDSWTTNRGKEGGWVVERLVTTLLAELDGGEQRRGVYVIGATNRPEVMDPALFRPGRFQKRLYVPLPSPEERGLILKALATKKKIDADVDLMALGKDDACRNFSGADLSGLMHQALMAAVDESASSIKDIHFKKALEKNYPSVSLKRIRYYENLSKRLKGA